MFPEADPRSFERRIPFEQIVDYEFAYENGERRLVGATIDDRLYGEFEFDASDQGDHLIIELLMSDPVMRLAQIQQLILPPEFATRPETADFSRLEHSIGCMLLTRKLGGSHEQQIRALLHDVAQTAFSHLGDWLKQGMDGADDHHDSMQIAYMKSFELDTMIESHGFDFESMFGPQDPDFVERPAPDLCVDRVDYALREFARWTSPQDVRRLVDELTVVDDMIAFQSREAARIFAKHYEDLFVWHWAHDEHAVKEKLFFTTVRHGIEQGIITEDDMYSIDQAVMVKLEMWGDDIIHTLLWLTRQNLTFRHLKGTYDALSLDSGSMESREDKLYFEQRPFKTRWVDPSYVDEEGNRQWLSVMDADFRTYLDSFLEVAEMEWSASFFRKIGQEVLHYVELEVEPDVKRVLAALPDFR